MFRQWMCIGGLVLVYVSAWTAEAETKIETASTEKVSGQRVALVIGNAAYDDHKLTNPVNDANSMAAALNACGFTVLKHTDLNRKEMANAILAFSDSIKRDGVGLFYYSGHAPEVDGENYLMPLDLKGNKGISLKIHGLSINLVLEMMADAGNRINILILDAANLAMVNAPSRTFIAYAAAPGTDALDGLFNSRNSPFTEALVEVIRKPGLRIEEVFKKVRTKVVKDTQGKQLPWVTSSLIKDFYFVLPAEPEIDSDSVQAFERGQMYYYGDGVEANTEEAMKWYHKAAEQGHPEAQFQLGQIYATTKYEDEKEAMKWWHKAAEQGHPEAQFLHAQSYYYGHYGQDVEDKKEAMKWYHKAAEQGSLYAQFQLGRIYYNGDDGLGVDKDEKEALKWFRKAAEQGYPIAQNYVDQIEANK